jgi:hypothetical protein
LENSSAAHATLARKVSLSRPREEPGKNTLKIHSLQITRHEHDGQQHLITKYHANKKSKLLPPTIVTQDFGLIDAG